MAGSSEIRAGAAYVELFVKGNIGPALANAQKQLKALGDNLMKIGKQLLGIGLAIGAPLALAAEQFASMGDALNKASQRTGISVEALSKLKYAAEQSGVQFEDLENVIKKMNKTVFDAADQSKGAEKALAAVGLTAEKLRGLSPDQQFQEIASGLAKISDVGTRAAVAMEIFGKNGTSILPLIEQGSVGIAALTKRAEELGLVMSAEDAAAATKFHDALDDVKLQVKQVGFEVGAAVAKALLPFAEAMTGVLKSVIEWARNNQALVVGLLTGAAAFVAMGTAMIGVALAIKTVTTIGSAMVAVWNAIAAAIAFCLNPIVLVIGGIIVLGVYFAKTTGYLGSAMDWLKSKFAELGQTASETFSGIADALAAGDITLAAQILWTGLQLAWAQGTHELMQRWIEFKYGFTKVAIDMWYGLLNIWETVKGFIVISWLNFVAILGNIADGFVAYFGSAWDGVTTSVAKKLLYVKSLFTGEDYAAEAKAADDQLAANQNARDDAAQARIATREEQLKKDLAEVQAKRDAAIAQNNQDSTDLNAGADAAAQQEIDDLDARKASLEDQLKKLREQAAKEKKTKAESKPPEAPKDKFSIEDILQQRQAIGSPAKSAGLFNARGIQGLQSTATDEYLKLTAKNTEEIAKNTRKTSKFK